jgi:hypothetical protein
MRRLLWIGTVLDLIFFLVALYAAGLALATAGLSGGPPRALVHLAAIALLPVLCILAPGLAWKRFDEALPRTSLLVVLTPFVYAALLAAFLVFL